MEQYPLLHPLKYLVTDTVGIQTALKQNGFAIVKVMGEVEVYEAKQLFYDWYTINEISKRPTAPHGYIRHYCAGHSAFSWYCRIHKDIQQVFKDYWNTDDLIVSYEGPTYIPFGTMRRNTCWLYREKEGKYATTPIIEGFLSLTNNIESTFCYVPGSIHYKDQFFSLEDTVKVAIEAGDLVLYDSRLYHQHLYYSFEERLVQPICYVPRNMASPNTLKKRKLYFDQKRTTTYHPASIRVHPLQPQTFGDTSKLIDYSNIVDPWGNVLLYCLPEIKKLI